MEHVVNLKLNTNVVAHKDVEVTVWEGGTKLGTLLVSKGNIEWRGAKKSLKKHRLMWGKFAALMEAEGRIIK